MANKIKRRLGAAAAVWLAFALLAGTAGAVSDELIPVGMAVGIQMDTDGVLVVDTQELETAEGAVRPAGDAGILPGDVITGLDGRSTHSSAELLEALDARTEGAAELTVEREGRTLRIAVTPLYEGGCARLGLLLRDGVAGVGTLTFFDPGTGFFGALGHGVNDAETGVLLPLGRGGVCRAIVTDVKPGTAGEPGALTACFDMGRTLGSITMNTACGIFGVMDAPSSHMSAALPVAADEEICAGAATILSNISGDTVESFDVEICRGPMSLSGGRVLNIRVTDEELLARTGGIVQGMSGSPIVQNGRLIGAVTHVLVGDPTRGYGITIGNMLAAAGTGELAA